MKPSRIRKPDPAAIQEAASLLKEGLLVGMPTETVYGLAADARSEDALKRLFAAKGRPADHPVIVHVGAFDWLSEWAQEMPGYAEKLAQRFWPGALTMVLPKKENVSTQVTGGQETVGVRMPAHSVALDLLQAFGGGLAAPSANRFGHISPTRAEHVEREMGEQVAMILDGGDCQVGVESTILDCTGETPRLLRPGGVTVAEIEQAIGVKVIAVQEAQEEMRAPGMLKSHYAPRTPAQLASVEEIEAILNEADFGVAVVGITPRPQLENARFFSMPDDPRAYAQKLYATLREADESGVKLILIEAVSQTAEWLAVTDRLKRATA